MGHLQASLSPMQGAPSLSSMLLPWQRPTKPHLLTKTAPTFKKQLLPRRVQESLGKTSARGKMGDCLFSGIFFLALLNVAVSSGFQYVTCGSAIKLANSENNVRLHSHDVKYGSGSGQQSVTGAKFLDDVNSYWIVKGPHRGTCVRGKPVACGSVIRLQHLQTRLFLHSHNFRSPLSNNQEVSCFGDGSEGDEGDNWIVECERENWSRDEAVRFKHYHTNAYLHISGHTYGRPIQGQYEVSAIGTKSRSNLWKAMEGVYMEPNSNSNTL